MKRRSSADRSTLPPLPAIITCRAVASACGTSVTVPDVASATSGTAQRPGDSLHDQRCSIAAIVPRSSSATLLDLYWRWIFGIDRGDSATRRWRSSLLAVGSIDGRASPRSTAVSALLGSRLRPVRMLWVLGEPIADFARSPSIAVVELAYMQLIGWLWLLHRLPTVADVMAVANVAH